MPEVPPSKLEGEALLRHLLEWGRATRGKGNLIFLTPSGIKFSKQNPHARSVVESHNRPILLHLVGRWVDAGLLHFSNGKYHFTERAMHEFPLKRKASFSEAQVLERIRAFSKPASMRPRKRK
ncbi:MAG: hypothetical protein IPJ89_05310 [Candidatus Iainarchaeum archaeon]|uniref:Uncharacterized protein n=1 Tax=Candidatus Iainarchaeum sp. TaxID=3101447 RepID=A0A7T9DJR8_9ARCH|nr:MAG: hypothetical protein IPJ89_05310 [Candidatus Diapherotrites archaeon]